MPDISPSACTFCERPEGDHPIHERDRHCHHYTARSDTSPTPVDLDAIERQAELTLRGTMLLTDVHNLIAELRTRRAAIDPGKVAVDREALAKRERLLQEYDIAFDNLLGAHAEVGMDSDEDRALHNRVMGAFGDLQTALRAALSEPQPKPEEPPDDSDPADYGYTPRSATPSPETCRCRTCGHVAIEHTRGRYSIYGVCPSPPKPEGTS